MVERQPRLLAGYSLEKCVTAMMVMCALGCFLKTNDKANQGCEPVGEDVEQQETIAVTNDVEQPGREQTRVERLVSLPVEQVTWNDDGTMTLVVRGHVEPVRNGDHVTYEKRDDACRDDLIDTVKAMLVACGGSEDDVELERQCNAAGCKPSDFIAAIGGRLLALISKWQASGRYGYCLPVIQVELIDDIERILRGEPDGRN